MSYPTSPYGDSQPPSTAAPDPGPYSLEHGEIRGRDGKKVADVTLSFKDSATFKANGQLLAASWETAAECDRLVVMNEKLQTLVQALLDNDPDDDAADGVTVLDVWRKDARAILAEARER